MTLKIKDVEPIHLAPGSSHDPESQCPSLLIFHGKLRQKQILYNISKKSYKIHSLPEMRNKFVLASNFGWLLLADYTLGDSCFFNFHSKEKVELPCRIRFDYSKCILTSTPTDPACRIILIHHFDRVVRFCSVGEDYFLKQEININGSYNLGEIITFNGRVYGTTFNGHALVEFQFRARSLQFQQVIQGIGSIMRPDTNYTLNYLVESGGELLFVHQTYIGLVDKYDLETADFKVFHADFARREWVRMKSLGDRAIFLCATEAKSCSASQANNIKGNCVYFTQTDDRNLYVFDMEDGSITVSLPCGLVDNTNLALHWM